MVSVEHDGFSAEFNPLDPKHLARKAHELTSNLAALEAELARTRRHIAGLEQIVGMWQESIDQIAGGNVSPSFGRNLVRNTTVWTENRNMTESALEKEQESKKSIEEQIGSHKTALDAINLLMVDLGRTAEEGDGMPPLAEVDSTLEQQGAQ